MRYNLHGLFHANYFIEAVVIRFATSSSSSHVSKKVSRRKTNSDGKLKTENIIENDSLTAVEFEELRSYDPFNIHEFRFGIGGD
jgi:hypothetical protein